MNPEIVSFQYTTGMCLLLENVGKRILLKFEVENTSDDKDFGNF